MNNFILNQHIFHCIYIKQRKSEANSIWCIAFVELMCLVEKLFLSISIAQVIACFYTGYYGNLSTLSGELTIEVRQGCHR